MSRRHGATFPDPPADRDHSIGATVTAKAYLMAKTLQRPSAEMPFLDHLEELRWRIIWSIAGIAAGYGRRRWRSRSLWDRRDRVPASDLPPGTCPGALKFTNVMDAASRSV